MEQMVIPLTKTWGGEEDQNLHGAGESCRNDAHRPPRKPYNLKERSSREKAELEIWLSGPLTNRREAGGADQITQKVCSVIRAKNKERILKNTNTLRGRQKCPSAQQKQTEKKGRKE